MAALVARPGAAARSGRARGATAKPRLPYFAVPRYIDVVDELPRTENGKVQKYRLRERGVTPALGRGPAGARAHQARAPMAVLRRTMFSLAGRTAFVTGAARGLGLAIARGLARPARAWRCPTSTRPVAAVAAEPLRADGHESLALQPTCATRPHFQRALRRRRPAASAPSTSMVNNAALTPHRSLWDITPPSGTRSWRSTCAACFFGCRVAGRHMRERGCGRILNLASIAGQQASSATGAHYAASKAGCWR